MNRRTFINQSLLTTLAISTNIKDVDYQNLINNIQRQTLNTLSNYGKILFLGDSITQASEYINFFECQLRLVQAELSTEVYNLGLSSETISGLSEEDHPYPRPYLLDRLDKVLANIQPDLIFACYGMNCGIYHPFSQQRFEQYQQGIQTLMAKSKEIGADLILLTPPPYAAQIDDWDKARADLHRNDYSYAKPYLAYDDVLKQYADWILSLKEVQTIDLYSPMHQYMSLCYDQDKIHPNIFGHQLMAHTILQHFDDMQPTVADQNWKCMPFKSVRDKSAQLKSKEMQKFTCATPKVNHLKLSNNAEYNQHILNEQTFHCKITGCSESTYQLFDQYHFLAQLNASELQQGILISPLSDHINYQKLSFVQKADQLFALIAAKRQVYDYALLQQIGHNRPMSREGLPIALAEAKRDNIKIEISALLKDKEWVLELISIT